MCSLALVPDRTLWAEFCTYFNSLRVLKPQPAKHYNNQFVKKQKCWLTFQPQRRSTKSVIWQCFWDEKNDVLTVLRTLWSNVKLASNITPRFFSLVCNFKAEPFTLTVMDSTLRNWWGEASLQSYHYLDRDSFQTSSKTLRHIDIRYRPECHRHKSESYDQVFLQVGQMEKCKYERVTGPKLIPGERQS